MTIYTRTGDDGTAGLPGGRRAPKSHEEFEALGGVDELNAQLGLCLAAAGAAGAEIAPALAQVQKDLLTLGAVLGAAAGGASCRVSLRADSVAGLERHIDAAWSQLPELTQFILPGGCELACRLHAARTVCRRAERRAVALNERAPLPPIALTYLNRLSDLLFALARLANKLAQVPEEPWK